MPNIIERWGLSLDEMALMLDSNPSLRGMVFGYLAEMKLHGILLASPMVTAIEKDDDHDRRRKGDRRIVYKDQEITIEIKSLQTNSIKTLDDGTFAGKAQCDASDRRTVTFTDGTELNTTCLRVGEFDLLAVNVFAFEETWRYVFALNRDLPRSTYSKYTEAQRSQLLASLITVTWPPQPPFTDDLFELLDVIAEEKAR